MRKHDCPDEYKHMYTERDAYLSRADPFADKPGFELHDAHVEESRGNRRRVIRGAVWVGVIVAMAVVNLDRPWSMIAVITGAVIIGTLIRQGIRDDRMGKSPVMRPPKSPEE